MTSNNKLAGMLIQNKVIDANFHAEPGDGILTREDIFDSIEKDPRLLQPFLILAAYKKDFYNEDDLPGDLIVFVKSLRELDPNGLDYRFIECRKTLEPYKVHIEHIVPKYFINH